MVPLVWIEIYMTYLFMKKVGGIKIAVNIMRIYYLQMLIPTDFSSVSFATKDVVQN